MTQLQRLLAALEAPPDTDSIDMLLAVWARVVIAMDQICSEPPAAVEDDVELAVELRRRHEAWQLALAGAKQRCGASRVGTAQIRRYQRSTRAAEP